MTYRSDRCANGKHDKCLGLLCKCECHGREGDESPVTTEGEDE